MQILAFPLGLVACFAVGIPWFFLIPPSDTTFDSLGIVLLAIVIIIIPIHELIHAAVHPHFGLSPHSILGLWPSRMLFYAHYAGEISRGRFVAILLMPLLVISMAPLLICGVAGHASYLLAFISTLNAFFACGDMFGVALVLFQIPAGATVRNQGWYTFWKIHHP